MQDYILLDHLLTEHAKGRVTMMGNLDNYVLFKYSQDCVSNDGWNEHNRKARGIIFYAPTATLACRPFDKFFNLDEKNESKLENLPKENFFIWEKLDGSCCSAYMHFGEIRCATPGSYESPQAEWATNWLRDYVAQMPEYAQKEFKEFLYSHTFIFEGIWPESAGNPSPGVLNYGDRQELVLLAIRENTGVEWHPNRVDEIADVYGLARPRKILVDSFDRTLCDKVPDNEEGYVIQFWPSNVRVKVKSPVYVMLHKYKEQITERGICEIFEAGESRRWLTTLPKHLAEKADDIIANLKSRYYLIYYAAKDVFEQASVLKTRKEQALYIQKVLQGNEISYRAICFNMLDNKLDERTIWKLLGNMIKEERKNMEVQDA